MNSMTWAIYLKCSFVLLAMYYTAIFILYFREVIPFLNKAQSSKKDSGQGASAGTPTLPEWPTLFKPKPVSKATTPVKPDTDWMYPQVHDLVDELQAYVKEAGQEGIAKEELIVSVQKILQKYPGIRGSPFQESIRNLVAVTLEDHCAIRLSADELGDLWKGEVA